MSSIFVTSKKQISKVLFTLSLGILSLFSSQPLYSQNPAIKDITVEWDTTKNIYVLYNQITKEKVDLRVPYARRGHRFLVDRFITVRGADMKALFNLKGEKLLDLSHYIHVNGKKKIIKAWVCGAGSWFILDFNGDTLSHSRSSHHYFPSLNKAFNNTHFLGEEQKITWGVLDHRGAWLIPPQFKDPLCFKNGKAQVVLFGYRVTFFEKLLLEGHYNKTYATKKQVEDLYYEVPYKTNH